MHPDEVGIAERVATAAARVGLERLVFHSVLHPDDARMPHHVRKAEAEALLRYALGTGLTVLRPAAYHQNLVTQALARMLRVPYSVDAPFTNVELADVAEVAADALLGAHAGLNLDLAGPEVLTTRQLAEQASAVLGREVGSMPISVQEWRAGPGATLPAQSCDDLAAMFTAYDDGGFTGDPTVLPRLLGRPATTWATCLSRPAPVPRPP